MNAQSSLQKGFSLVEMLLVIALAGMLVGFASIGLSNSQQTTSVATATDSIISDIKSQQAKAMLGKAKDPSASPLTGANYGIRIESDKYILFSDSYVAGAPSNQTVQLDGIILSTTFSSSQIVFQQINGEVVSFNPSNNTIIVKDANSTHPKTITINKYGSVR